MEIRKVDESDIPEIQKLLTIAFEVAGRREKPDFLKMPGNEPQDHRDRDWMNRFVAVEDGAVLSSVASYDYQVRFDGGALVWEASAMYPHFRSTAGVAP